MTNNEIRNGIEKIRVSANSILVISKISPTVPLKELQKILEEHLEKIEQFEREFNTL